MGDYAIQMQVDIGADPQTIHRAIASQDGIRSWWTAKADLSGGQLRTWFPDRPEPFQFALRDEPGGTVEYVTGAFPPWWQGTTVRWWTESIPDAPGTRLQFRHGGYDPDNPVIPLVTPAWALILQRLKSYAETGRPDPFFAF
jgi:uncharacterized protein YndB with AHSA1/START domain